MRGHIPGCIRAVTSDDAPAIQAIYAPYVTNTIISFETTPPSMDEMAGRIQKIVSKYPWLVYVTDGQAGRDPVLAGYVYASTHSERAAYQWSVDVTVYVHPDYQRRNIGRGLYTALFALLRAQGYFNAYAGISLPNAGSVGIHMALGFELVGIYQKVGYKFGAWHDVGWWGLRLMDLIDEPPLPTPINGLIDSPLWQSAMQSGLVLMKR